jgi:hypothetical protein
MVTDVYVGYPDSESKHDHLHSKKASEICIIPSLEPIKGKISVTGLSVTP